MTVEKSNGTDPSALREKQFYYIICSNTHIQPLNKQSKLDRNPFFYAEAIKVCL